METFAWNRLGQGSDNIAGFFHGSADNIGYVLFAWSSDEISQRTGFTPFATIGGFGHGFAKGLGNILAAPFELHHAIPQAYQSAGDYYDVGGGGVNGTLLAVPGVTGYSGIAESIYGHDILTGQQINVDQRVDRLITGIAGAATIAVAVGGLYTGYAPIAAGVNQVVTATAQATIGWVAGAFRNPKRVGASTAPSKGNNRPQQS